MTGAIELDDIAACGSEAAALAAAAEVDADFAPGVCRRPRGAPA